MIRNIKIDTSLFQSFDTINAAIDAANNATTKSENAIDTANQAKQTANTALSNSESTQDQLDTIVVESGTSDAEVLQARTNNRGRTFDVLKDRLDDFDIEFRERAVNVKWYGASGSDQATTGNIDSGSNVLTVTDTIDFEAGQGIAIEGAGANGDLLVSTINVIDPAAGTITVEDSATVSVSNAAVRHNDSVAVSNAIDDLVLAGGGTAFFPLGTYNVNLDFSYISTAIHITGTPGTKFRTNTTIEVLKIIKNVFEASRLVFENIVFEGDAEGEAPPYQTSNLVHFYKTYAKFYKCQFNYAGHTGLFGEFSQYNEFHECRFGGNGVDGINIQPLSGAEKSNENLFFKCHFNANGRDIDGYRGRGLLSQGNEVIRVLECSFISNYIALALGGGAESERKSVIKENWFEINIAKSIEIGVNNESICIEDNFFAESKNNARILDVDSPYDLVFQKNYILGGQLPIINGSGANQTVFYFYNNKDVDPASSLTGGNSFIYKISGNAVDFGLNILEAGGINLKGAPNHYVTINNSSGAFQILNTKGGLVAYINHSGDIVSSTGEVNVLTGGNGVLVTTPDGTKKYRISVKNDGSIISTLV